MNGKLGWIVAAIVIVAAGAFYFWPSIMQAPATTEETNEQTNTQPTSQADMAGTWRSDRDAKFTREIRADGVMIDRYEGDTTAGVNGEWSVVTNVAAETAIANIATNYAGMTVVKVTWEGGVETTYFVVNKIEQGTMTTTDLTGRGEVTIWTRV